MGWVYSKVSWVTIIQFIPLVLFVRKGNKNKYFSGHSCLLKHNKVALNNPFQVLLFFFFFFCIPFYMKREGEVWSATARLSWFYSKQSPLRNVLSEWVSLLPAGVSVECIRFGEETVSARCFIIGQYCTETDPRCPSLRSGEEKLRKCQNQWILFI